jgi:hypothetical protein
MSEEDINDSSKSVDFILELVKTTNIDETNEYMILSGKGLLFIKIMQIKRPEN